MLICKVNKKALGDMNMVKYRSRKVADLQDSCDKSVASSCGERHEPLI